MTEEKYRRTRVIHQHQVVVAVLTFFVYVSVYANRKSFSNVKVLVAEEWSPFNRAKFLNGTHDRSKQPAETWSNRSFFPGSNDASLKMFLGVFNSVFMVTYATFQYVGGFLGDRINVRLFLSSALFGSSTMVIMCFCMSEWFGIYSAQWYIAFWILNAMCQGPAWPCILSAMNNWFAKSKNRGLIFGIWSSNVSCGNVFGSLLVASLVDYGYEFAILVPAVLQISVAIIVFLGLVVSPQEIGLTLDDDRMEDKEKAPLNQEPEKQLDKPVTFMQALSIPGVVIYAFSYAALKLVTYGFFFWMPFYFNRRFHWSQADAARLSIWFDIGGVTGATVIGFLMDRFNKPGVLFVHLFLGLPSIVIFSFLPGGKIVNASVLFVIGYFISGSANTITAVVAADLGRHPKLDGNKKAQATVSGILDGTGSSCAALGQLAIPLIEQWFGWSSVFYMLLFCSCLTCLGVGRIVFNDMKQWRNSRNQHQNINKNY